MTRRRRWHPAGVAGVAAVLMGLVLGAMSIPHATAATPPPAPENSMAPPPVSGAPTGGGGCTIIDGRADARCTPGARNPDVTQNSIDSTICRRGWTNTVRPPQSYTDQLKQQQMPVYGLSMRPADVEEDHLLALEIGGDPRDPANLWPEPRSGPRGATAKDQQENRLRADICARRVSLADAQRQWLTDWTHQ